MSSKLVFLFSFCLSLCLCSPIPDSDEEEDEGIFPKGISLGSQQDSQSSQENLNSKEGAQGIQQHHQGQQQLAAKIGDKHYVLQQQVALGQQLARLGKKTAVQQLADAQKQAVANGQVNKDGHSKTNEELRDN